MFFSIDVCKHVHLCTACVPCMHGRQKLLGPLELDLQIVENYHAPLGSLEEQPILLTVERLSGPCYISLIQGGVKSEFLNRWFWFYSVLYLWEYLWGMESIRSQPTIFLWCSFFSFFWEAPYVLELGDLPASFLRVLGLHESTATPSLISLFCSF